MAESDLYPLVRSWLESRGCIVHVEIFDADVIGVNADGRIVVVEMKACLTDGLMRQLHQRASWADEVWAAIYSHARATGYMRQMGYGLLELRKGQLRQRHKARPQPWHWHKRRTYRQRILAARPPAMQHERAGLPSSPALAQQRYARTSPPVNESTNPPCAS